jgi:DNA-directed RNA polymerase specialized sigma24 family protein
VSTDPAELLARLRGALACAGASQDEIDECSQAAAVELLVRHATIRDHTREVSYAVTIALRLLWVERRRAGRLVAPGGSMEGVIGAPMGGDPADEVAGASDAALVAEALAALSARDRFLVLGSAEGLSVEALAAGAGLARTSVAPSLQRARRRLRAHMSSIGGA